MFKMKVYWTLCFDSNCLKSFEYLTVKTTPLPLLPLPFLPQPWLVRFFLLIWANQNLFRGSCQKCPIVISISYLIIIFFLQITALFLYIKKIIYSYFICNYAQIDHSNTFLFSASYLQAWNSFKVLIDFKPVFQCKLIEKLIKYVSVNVGNFNATTSTIQYRIFFVCIIFIGNKNLTKSIGYFSLEA